MFDPVSSNYKIENLAKQRTGLRSFELDPTKASEGVSQAWKAKCPFQPFWHEREMLSARTCKW